MEEINLHFLELFFFSSHIICDMGKLYAKEKNHTEIVAIILQQRKMKNYVENVVVTLQEKKII